MLADPLLALLAAAAVLFAGVSKAGFGSGASFLGVAILALVLPPAEALALMMPALLVIDFASLRPYWKRWDRAAARRLVLGGIPGACAGALVFTAVSSDAIRALIGAICLAFVGLRFVGRRPTGQANPALALATGFGAGFTSFVSHAGGPLVAMLLLRQGLTKTAYQATTVVVFWAINLVKVPLYAGLGFFGRDILIANLWLAPLALVGTWLGVLAHRRVPERPFFAITYALLAVTGARLLWVGLG